MASLKHHVTIKGVQDGLVFVLDDTCEYADLIHELRHKLEKTHEKILTGPVIHVKIKLGNRSINDEQKQEIRSIISQKGNLFIQSIETAAQADWPFGKHESAAEVARGIVRSGQTLQYERNVLFLGDVNPGGTIICSGDIYVLGSLRGMAHAGSAGNTAAIIAASHLRPTQLRIAGIISRPPDEWEVSEAVMEFAYIRDGHMEIDQISQLHRIRNS